MKEIKLTKGFYAYVDDEDYERVSAFKWYASVEGRGTKVYAIRWTTHNRKRTKIRMHRFVLGVHPRCLDGLVVDHVNGDSLDNRRSNLELITQAENMNRVETWNRSKAVSEVCL